MSKLEMSKLPAFIRVFVHLVLLAAALVALPYTLLLCIAQSVVLAAAFAPADAKSTEPAPPILAHAICWPLRLALALLLHYSAANAQWCRAERRCSRSKCG